MTRRLHRHVQQTNFFYRFHCQLSGHRGRCHRDNPGFVAPSTHSSPPFLVLWTSSVSTGALFSWTACQTLCLLSTSCFVDFKGTVLPVETSLDHRYSQVFRWNKTRTWVHSLQCRNSLWINFLKQFEILLLVDFLQWRSVFLLPKAFFFLFPKCW